MKILILRVLILIKKVIMIILNDGNNNKNEDDTIQIYNDSNTPNKKIIDGLKLLYLKSLYNFTESAYDDIMKIFIIERISLYKVKKYLKEVTGLVPVFYDMCENSCICYTGQYEFYQTCPMCLSTRLDAKGKAKKVMPYLSIKNRLKIQFNDENRVKEFLYRHEYIIKKENLLVPFLIPGPKQPKDFNSFLRPFINEMKELESR